MDAVNAEEVHSRRTSGGDSVGYQGAAIGRYEELNQVLRVEFITTRRI